MTTGDGITLADLRLKKKANTKVIWIAGDPEAADLLGTAQEELARAQRLVNLRGAAHELQLTVAEERVAEVREQIKDTLIRFKFQAMAIPDWDAIVGEHTWTDPQKAEWRKKATSVTDDQMENMPIWNPETFPKALIAACFVEPAISQAEMVQWLDDPEWNSTELMALFNAALEVNNSRRVVELGKE